jgi:hypothetical protein
MWLLWGQRCGHRSRRLRGRYGDRTGPASATLLGVGRTARDTTTDIVATLQTTGRD